MGFTLDQLLDVTGVDTLAGRGVEKTAAPHSSANLLKLAERCRTAADTADVVPAQISERDLVEKTAAVQIIRRTLAEVEAIERGGTIKTASATPRAAVFIKTALEAGHSPEAIARFLEQQPGQPPRRPDPKKSKSTATMIR